MAELASLALAAATALTAGLAIFRIWPAVARARFIADVSALRDEVEDDVLAGRLPDVPSVQHVISRADLAQRDAESLSLAFLLAWHQTAAQYNCLPPNRRPSYNQLSQQHRKLLHEYDKRFVDALERRLRRGSTLAIPLRMLALFLPRARGKSAPPAPGQLAREYQRAPHPPMPQHA